MTDLLRNYDPENLTPEDIRMLVDECHRLRSEYIRDAFAALANFIGANATQAGTVTWRGLSDLHSRLQSLRPPKPFGSSGQD